MINGRVNLNNSVRLHLTLRQFRRQRSYIGQQGRLSGLNGISIRRIRVRSARGVITTIKAVSADRLRFNNVTDRARLLSGNGSIASNGPSFGVLSINVIRCHLPSVNIRQSVSAAERRGQVELQFQVRFLL